MKENYQKQMEAVLDGLQGAVPRLLLHSCCGPCSSYVLETLSRHFSVTLLFYGPNIQPEQEYRKRLEHQKKLLAALPTIHPVTLLDCGYDGETYTRAVRGLETEPEGGARCTACFRLRLEETARRAHELGFDWYCTTLTVSPHKDAERINALGREIGQRWGVSWLPCDFKKRGGYQRSIELAAQYGLYRQNYCGCLYSKRDD